MRYLNQPLARAVLVSGAVIGASAAVLADQYTGLWLTLIGAWAVVAGAAAYPIIKNARQK